MQGFVVVRAVIYRSMAISNLRYLSFLLWEETRERHDRVSQSRRLGCSSIISRFGVDYREESRNQFAGSWRVVANNYGSEKTKMIAVTITGRDLTNARWRSMARVGCISHMQREIFTKRTIQSTYTYTIQSKILLRYLANETNFHFVRRYSNIVFVNILRVFLSVN